MAMLNKDFYRNLPSMVPPILEDLIRRYQKEEWFEKAWNEYRHHILSSSMDEMKMPGFVFKKYIKDSSVKHSDDSNKFGVPEQKKFPLPDADHVRSAIKFFNYVDPEHEKELARAILLRAKEYGVDISEINVGENNRFKKYVPKNELMHFGILGQKWGIRRFQNLDGTLTPAGKERYGQLGSDKNNLRWVDKTAMRRASTKIVYTGSQKPGKHQQEVLDRYKKEADDNKFERKLTKMDKELLEKKKEYEIAKANNDEKKLRELNEYASNFKQEYYNNMMANSVYGFNHAKMFVKEMNTALVKDLDFKYVDLGASYLTENGLGWNASYIYNRAYNN